MSQTWNLVKEGMGESSKVDVVNPFTGHCMLLMVWRRTRNVFGGGPNSQTTSEVQMENFKLYTCILPLCGTRAKAVFGGTKVLAASEEVDRHFQVRRHGKLLRTS